MLVVLEGLDFSGKTTVASLVAKELKAIHTREPGGTPLGEKLRPFIIEQDDPFIKACLVTANRVDHINTVILPAILKRRYVVTERYFYSTLVYQKQAKEVVDAMLKYCSYIPHIVIFLDIDYQTYIQRLHSGREVDRMDLMSEDVFNERRQDYLNVIRNSSSIDRMILPTYCKTVEDTVDIIVDYVRSKYEN